MKEEEIKELFEQFEAIANEYEGAEDGENHGGEYRIDSCKHADADASERGMGDAAADEYQSAGNDVGSDKAAQDACQKGAYQCVLEKCIL